MTQQTLHTEEARQAERKPGMFMVLAVSTIMAAIAVGATYAFMASS